MFHVSIWGDLSFIWGGLAPKAPRGDGTGNLFAMTEWNIAGGPQKIITFIPLPGFFKGKCLGTRYGSLGPDDNFF